MPNINEIILEEKDGGLTFGNYKLEEKTKASDFPYRGDKLKVKTYKDITKLENNGNFVYESVPGTRVFDFNRNPEVTTFSVEGLKSTQIIIALEEDQTYAVLVEGESIGNVKTNLSGKLTFSVDLEENKKVDIMIQKR